MDTLLKTGRVFAMVVVGDVAGDPNDVPSYGVTLQVTVSAVLNLVEARVVVLTPTELPFTAQE